MKLRISPQAAEDIVEIKRYICSEYFDSAAADRIVNKLMETYECLELSPYIGRRLETRYNIEHCYRYLVCENYLIFYTVSETVISIDRVIHGKRDYCKLLFNIESSDK
jgi:addiction module RelE/StbE family toxin